MHRAAQAELLVLPPPWPARVDGYINNKYYTWGYIHEIAEMHSWYREHDGHYRWIVSGMLLDGRHETRQDVEAVLLRVRWKVVDGKWSWAHMGGELSVW